MKCVCLRAVYIPSTPIVGSVNIGNIANTRSPVVSSGFSSNCDMRSALKNSIRPKMPPNSMNILVNRLTRVFCSPVLKRGMKYEKTLGSPNAKRLYNVVYTYKICR